MFQSSSSFVVVIISTTTIIIIIIIIIIRTSSHFFSLLGTGFWSGLHRPFSTFNNSWEYQDCEPMSSSLTFSNPGAISNNQHCGVFKNVDYDVYEAPCNEEKPFICLRYIGKRVQLFVLNMYAVLHIRVATSTPSLHTATCLQIIHILG